MCRRPRPLHRRRRRHRLTAAVCWELIPLTDLSSAELLDTLNGVRQALALHLPARAPGEALVWSPSRENDLVVMMEGETLALPLKPPGRHGGCAQSLGAQALLLTLHRQLPESCLRLADAHGKALTPTDFLKTAEWLQDPCLRALAETLGLVGPAVDFTQLGGPVWFL